ncbi:SET domain-containing protein [Atractiella rhizophila]|nr:SET domain-containing protein [Atractiella rhizophila]
MSFAELKIRRDSKQVIPTIPQPRDGTAQIQSVPPDEKQKEHYYSDYEGIPSDTIDIRFSPLNERGLYTKKTIQPGSCIIAIPPYVAVLDNMNLSSHCSNCYSSRAKLQRCSGCKIVNYCSPGCQRLDWNDVHKHECRALKVQKDGIVETPIRAMGRILWKRQADPGKWKEIQALKSHKDDMASGQKERYGKLAMALGYYIGPESIKKNFSEAAELMDFCCQFASNSFSLTSYDLDNIGVAISPAIALINHSCTPNAVVVFPNSSQMAVVALRQLEDGEEILTSYIDISLPVDMRQADLKDTYFFTCKCQLCTLGSTLDPRKSLHCQSCGAMMPFPDDGPGAEAGASISSLCSSCKNISTLDVAQVETDISLANRTLQRVANMIDPQKALPLLLPSISSLLHTHHLHPASHPLFSLLRLAQSHLLASGPSHFAAAGKMNDLVINGAEYLYPQRHPARGVARAVGVQLRVARDVEGGAEGGNLRERRIKLLEVELDAKKCLEELTGFGAGAKLRTELEQVLDGVQKERRVAEEVERMTIGKIS